MKTYMLTTNTKHMNLVKTIIKNEGLEATAAIEADALGNLWITITTDDREEYDTIKDIYNMVA